VGAANRVPMSQGLMVYFQRPSTLKFAISFNQLRDCSSRAHGDEKMINDQTNDIKPIFMGRTYQTNYARMTLFRRMGAGDKIVVLPSSARF
jgi:hypothetical protein